MGEMYFFEALLKSRTQIVPNGWWVLMGYTVRKNSHEAEGFSYRSSSKKRKTSPPVAFEAKEEEDEFLWAASLQSVERIAVLRMFLICLALFLGFLQRWQILRRGIFSRSSRGSDLPDVGVDPEVQPGVLPSSVVLSVISPLAVVPSSTQPSVLGAAIVSASGTFGSMSARKSSMPVANVVGGLSFL
ncbi:hypothetical protein CJ030_MR7G005999 [Morella rubra]|uniref:Uncharacterized protein n=1 Tax=Morella rubra TaxID=262757 RepID=A0A6A1V0B2_9ROSI|nr:hypothetical protein CJ030_MR7G005999 [Morella rubra]